MPVDEEIEEGRRRSAFTGLLVSLFILLAILGAIIAFAVWQSRGLDFTLHFEDAKGIRAGDPVVLSGVPIGQVKKVTLVGEDDVRVAVRVDEEHSEKVLTGSTAVITSMSFPNVSGQKVVEIHNPSDPVAEPLADDAEVEGRNGMFDLKAWEIEQRIGDLGGKLSEQSKVLAKKIEIMAEELKEIPESPEAQEALRKLEEFSKDLEIKGREKFSELSEQWEDWSQDLAPLLEEWKIRGREKAAEVLEKARQKMEEPAEETPLPQEEESLEI